ncbi:hypothetical protein C5167_048461 [Papaver somniferum]|uniref:Uncharacterized protein n=1 Tax=Papaver somniferum TaxID=3469 RepID=A0A4Y7KLL3_PAPSO|nr:hypothetical protein C5167_048461 [Papaver somniferum]
MGGGGAHHGEAASHVDFRTKVWSMPGGPYCRPVHWKRNTAVAMFGIFLVCIPIAMKSAELEATMRQQPYIILHVKTLYIFLELPLCISNGLALVRKSGKCTLAYNMVLRTPRSSISKPSPLRKSEIEYRAMLSKVGVRHSSQPENSYISNRLALVRKSGKCTLGYNIVRRTLRSFISNKCPPLRKSEIECCGMVAKVFVIKTSEWRRVFPVCCLNFFIGILLSYSPQQRPHMPVRPIPSQLWCKNFGENSKKDY